MGNHSSVFGVFAEGGGAAVSVYFVMAAVAVLLLVLWMASGPVRTAWRRQRLRSQPFPAEWRDILRRRVPYFRQMPVDLQLQLKRHIQVFMAEKPFIGCAGLVVTDEIRVTIAAQACLLLLNRRTGYYPQLRQVLVYPAAFLVQRSQHDGAVQHEQRHALAGESWSQGQVILSWDDALQGATTVGDGRNVVIHEFAHQLDQENGDANGAPYLGGGAARLQRWSQVLGDAFAQLQAQLQRGEPTLLDGYGATNPAEFFAVVSEVFFEQAPELAQVHPALYAELRAFYRVDPLSW